MSNEKPNQIAGPERDEDDRTIAKVQARKIVECCANCRNSRVQAASNGAWFANSFWLKCETFLNDWDREFPNTVQAFERCENWSPHYVPRKRKEGETETEYAQSQGYFRVWV